MRISDTGKKSSFPVWVPVYTGKKWWHTRLRWHTDTDTENRFFFRFRCMRQTPSYSVRWRHLTPHYVRWRHLTSEEQPDKFRWKCLTKPGSIFFISLRSSKKPKKWNLITLKLEIQFFLSTSDWVIMSLNFCFLQYNCWWRFCCKVSILTCW